MKSIFKPFNINIDFNNVTTSAYPHKDVIWDIFLVTSEHFEISSKL